MCSLFLKPESGEKKNRFFRRINLGLATGNRFYGRMIRGALKHSRRMLAAFGIANMWMAVFADVGTALLVVANGLRAMRQ